MTYNITPYQKAYMDAHQIANDPVMELDIERVLHFAEIWKRQKPDASEEEIEAHAIGNAVSETYGIPKGAEQDAAREFLDSQRVVKVFEATRYIHGEQLPQLITHAEQLAPALDGIKDAVASAEAAVDRVASAVRSEGAEFDIFLVQQISDLKTTAWKCAKWVIGWAVVMFILATICAVRSFAQVDCVQFLSSSSTVTANYCAPFKLKEGTGISFSKSGTTLTISSTGGGASPAGSGSEIQYRVNGTTFGAVAGSSVSGGNITIGSPMYAADGSSSLPSYTFTANHNTGIWESAGGGLGLAAAGTDLAYLTSTTVQFLSTGVFAWVSSGGASSSSADTGISRLGAASFAFGNGTAGSFSGSIKATTINAATAFQVNGSALNFTHLTGSVAAGQMPALTGDVTSGAGTVATTLASVVTASNCGDTTHSCGLTYDAKGRITAATNNVIAGGSANPTNLSVKGQTTASTVSTGALCTSGLLVYSFKVPANTLTTADTLSIKAMITKSGVTDAPRYCIALGTASGSGTACTDAQSTTATDTGYKLECLVTVTGASAEATEATGQRYISGGGTPALDSKTGTLALAVNADIWIDVFAYNVNSIDTVRGQYFIATQNINK